MYVFSNPGTLKIAPRKIEMFETPPPMTTVNNGFLSFTTWKEMFRNVMLFLLGGIMKKKFVCYYRLSVRKQTGTQHGIAAQREAVRRYVSSVNGKSLVELEEIESATGRKHRPVLQEALAICEREGATLCISRIDRLTRSVAFLGQLQESGVDFVACDNPHATPFTIGILALVAQHEAETIRKRIVDGLAAAKRAGVVLGAPKEAREKALQKANETRGEKADTYVASAVEALKAIEEKKRKRVSLQQLADIMNRGKLKPRRGKIFHPQTISRIKKRGEALGIYP